MSDYRDADYSPDIPNSGANTGKQNYNPTGSFRFWAQKVLPTVYDDSLSYYEILTKVVNYLNSVIQNVDSLNDSVDNTNSAFDTLQGYVNNTKDTIISAYNELQGYVNSYFDSLDVQEEINAKLDVMASDGSLSELLSPFIPSLVSDWLSKNITPTSPAIDASLSVGGAGADAKVTGDFIRDLKNTADNIGVVSPIWEQGGLSYNDGNPYVSANRSRTTDFIEFGASVDFVVTIPADHQLTVYYYDSSKTFISYTAGLNTVYYGTTLATAKYVKFQVSKDDTSASVPATYGNDCKIYLISKSLMRAFADFGFRWLQLTPTKYPTIADFPINTVAFTALSWLSTADDLPVGSGYYYIFTIGRSIIEYNAIQIAVDPYTYAPTFYIRRRTSVAGGYSVWRKIGERVLNSSGDTTDRISDIQTMLDTFGVCHLGEGVFYISSHVNIPNLGKLYGEGNKTILIRTGETGSAVLMNSYSSVSDLWIRGDDTEITPTVNNQGKHGITWLGTYDYSTTKTDGPYCGTISNVTITDCKGVGIFTWKSGREPSTGLNVCNVIIKRCGWGVAADNNSEFSQWLNLKITSCGIGVRCTGGNQIFTNCNFSSNIQALDMEGTTASLNNSHGGFSNCIFNHSGANTGYAMKLKGMVNGEIFTGCQVFYGKIKIENCAGVRIIGANFGRQTDVEIINSSAVIFSDCQMSEATDTPVTITGGTSVIFRDCYCRDGSKFNVT